MNESHPEFKKLVQAVDRREDNKEDENQPEDWSNRVEVGITLAEQSIIRTANLLRQYLPNFDAYLKSNLDSFYEEIKRIRSGLPPKREKLNENEVDALIQDILDGSEQSDQEVQFLDLAQKEPLEIIRNVSLFKNKSYYEKLLETALVSMIDQKEEYRLFDHFPLFEGKPYLDREFRHGLKVAYEKSDEEFFSFLDQVVGKSPAFLQDPEVLALLSKAVLDMTFHNPKLGLKYFSIIGHLPDADRLFQIQIDLLVKRNPKALMTYVDLWEHRVPNLNEIVVGLVNYTRYSDPTITLGVLAHFPSVEFPEKEKITEETVRWTARVQPDVCLERADFLKDLPYGKEVIDIATRRKVIFDALTVETPISLGDFMADPALKDVHLIESAWLPDVAAQDFGKVASYLCRNLFLQGKPITQEGVQREYIEWLKLREQYSEQTLFTGRNVVLASHVEKWPNGQDRFAPSKLVEAVRRQQGENVSFQHNKPTENSLEALQAAKSRSLIAIANTEPPLTFLFDGHGGPGAIYFSDGQNLESDTIQLGEEPSEVRETEKTIKITVEELAEALLDRVKKFGTKAITADILVFSSCYNHTFIRALYSQLKKKGCPLPITLGASEYDQLGFSNRNSGYGCDFFEKVLNLDSGKTTLGDIWRNEEKGYTNPTLYVPSNGDNATPVQLALGEKEHGNVT